MVNYENGKIYKLYHKDNDKYYIGSTTQDLNIRLAGHKCHQTCKSKSLFEYDTLPIIELIENYSCNGRNELRIREQYHIDLNKANLLNHSRANMTKQDRNKYMVEFRKKPHMKDRLKAIQIKHNELAKVKVLCEHCDKLFSKSSMYRHKKICN